MAELWPKMWFSICQLLPSWILSDTSSEGKSCKGTLFSVSVSNLVQIRSTPDDTVQEDQDCCVLTFALAGLSWQVLKWRTSRSSSSYRLHCMPSHLIASSPARCKVVRPPGNLDRGQSFTIWLIVCLFAVLQHHKYKMGLVSCANEQDLQHIVPDRFWNGLILPTDVEVSWSQEEQQWDRRPRIGWSHLYPAIHHTIHQELTPVPEEHPTILDAVMADGLDDDSRCLREVASYHSHGSWPAVLL